MGKRGLSTVVTTLIIIVLVLVAAGMVWVVIRNLLSSGSDEISIERFAIDLEITSVEKGGTFLYVKVKRNVGEGDLVAIKFILSDDKNSEVVEKSTDINELETRTFRIGQEDCDFVNISNVTKVSIAPVFELRSGKTSLGDIVISQNIKEVEGGDLFSKCVEDYDCATEERTIGLINNTEKCGFNGDLYQEWQNYTCEDGECYSQVYDVKVADCNDTGCDEDTATCIGETVECTTDEECETLDCPFGCSPVSCIGNVSYLAWESHYCNMTDNTCISNITSILLNNCTDMEPKYTKICGDDGNCYDEIECMNHDDCYNPTKKCDGVYCMCEFAVSAVCVEETIVLSGTVGSTWPPDGAQYFDSQDFEKSTNPLYAGFYILFTSGNESTSDQCSFILEYTYSSKLDNAYISLGYVAEAGGGLTGPKELMTGDTYEIWRTSWNCHKRIEDLGL